MSAGGDKYRWFLTPEDIASTDWINGPPNYDIVNKLFEEGRTQVWPEGSDELYVQFLAKTWEMELVNKANPQQYKTVNPDKFTISMNGKKVFTLKEVGEVGGSYNVFLHTSLSPSWRYYDPDKETYTSSQTAFRKVFPRGFALEVNELYSRRPKICFKFRHWGYMEGSFKENPPSGKLVELFGIAVYELDDNDKVISVEFYLDRGEMLAPLMTAEESTDKKDSASGCPFLGLGKAETE